MINNIHAVPRLLYMRPFKPYFHAGRVEGPDVAKIVRRSVPFLHVQSAVEQVIEEDFERATSYAQQFEEYRVVHCFGENWNYEAYAQSQQTATFKAAVVNFKQDMAQLNKWFKDLERMKLSGTERNLYVDSKTLKHLLTPITVRSLDKCRGLLLQVARDRCVASLQEYQQRMRDLGEQPRSLRDFAEYCDNVNTIFDESRDMELRGAQVNEMYDLLDKYEVKIPSQDAVKKDDLKEAREAFSAKVEEANGAVEQRMPAMTASLDKSITKLNEDLMVQFTTLHTGEFVDPVCDPKVVLERLEEVRASLEAMSEQADGYKNMQETFHLAPHEFTQLRDTISQYELKHEIWTKLNTWNEQQFQWKSEPFHELDVEELVKEVQQYFKDVHKMTKRLPTDAVVGMFKESVEDFKDAMGVITDLGNEALAERHWRKIFDKLEQPFFPGQAFTMEQLLRFGVLSHAEFIGEVSAVASGEFGLEQLLAKIRSGWAETAFVTLNHRDQSDLFILGGLDEVITQLEDSQVSLQTILASRFVSGIRTEVEEWEKKLGLVSEIMDEWLACQRSWMYLENIFGAEDIQKQLPAESMKFKSIDKFFKDRMRKTNENPNVIVQVTVPELLNTFLTSNKVLDEIQKSLEDYLETKRTAFPRFYFLSNDELLEIMSQTRDPHAVQPHLIKCFDAVKNLTFGEGDNSRQMCALNSAEAEKVPFTSPPTAEGPVEDWLMRMQVNMMSTLWDTSKDCLQKLATMPFDEWYCSFPAQSVIMVGCIQWTGALTEALDRVTSGEEPQAIANYNVKWVAMIANMVGLVRTQLTPLQRKTLSAKLTIDVHARDTNTLMAEMGVQRTGEFEWQKQLRYYWEEEADDCIIRQTNTRFTYGYEYLGNSMRLVITPLTDKCYMTLTGALNLGMGGAPAGPAGTGKTETTKDLAKALARQCVVMNCGPDLTAKMMSQFFSGLAQSGAWACFDEFNRIDLEVLSVIAQQVLTIQEAFKSLKETGADRFNFEGRDIPLNPAYGAFITMNPGYAGRAELPDNLKALFRPVAMMVPDYRLIAEIMLFSEGFGEAKPLSNKMTQLYKLSSEQLSKQDHYDFGMRAVKSVLVMAGQLKRENPDLSEDVTLIRALRDSNLPKFLYDDVPLFMAIIQDLFPGKDIPVVDYGRLQSAIERELQQAQLQVVQTYVAKIIQLFETMLVRHGVMLVGLTLTGKSCCSEILGAALTQLKRDGEESPQYEVVKRHLLNPKSVTMGQLYGEVNPVTQEWTDGLVPTLVRMSVHDESDAFNWIIFDGPVDALWIENMNTVLDDNKMLCLSNGERIKLKAGMHMMFEVNDLSVASPATVSRCGMVYMEAVYIGNRPLLLSWVQHVLPKRLPAAAAHKHLLGLFDKFLEPAIEHVRESGKEGIASVDGNLIGNLLKMLDAVLQPAFGVRPVDEEGNVDMRLVNLWFVFCFTWTLGGNLREDSRVEFDAWIRQSGMLTDLAPNFPDNLTIFEVCVSFGDVTAFVPWTDIMNKFAYSKEEPYFNILVPTGETTCYNWLLQTLVIAGSHTMLIGETGTGKSVTVQAFLKLLPENANSIQAAFSAQTAAINMQDILESKLDKLRKNLLGAPPGRQTVLFVDDINMPALEKYGAQPPIELVRQVLAQGGFYDLKKLFFKKVQNTSFVAGCGPPGGGRNPLTARLTRHFTMLWVPELAKESMRTIFSSILGGFLAAYEFSAEQVALAQPLVDATIECYAGIREAMLPTPSKSHYTFNLRDISKVMQGMLQMRTSKCADADQLVRLWMHEASRVFCDRLVDDDDRAWFDNKVAAIIKETEGLGGRDWDPKTFHGITFGSYMQSSAGVEQALYEETELTKTQAKFDEACADFNAVSTKPMNLVFFADACLHLARVSRIITQPRGNALLVGVGGSGRQSMTRMACAMWDFQCMSIEISRTYDVTAFHDDLKRFMFAAIEKPVVFLFSDTQIVKESFLEDINNMLNAGEVPNLMETEDMERLLNLTRPLAKAAGKEESRDVVYAHFVQLVRENLHVALAMSPIGDGFRVRCRMFPSLINCCTIDWFNAWPKDALLSVAQRYFADMDLGSQETKDGICEVCVEMHYSAQLVGADFMASLRRMTYTTPTSYLELLNLYASMLGEQRSAIASKIDHYQGGVTKLVDTNIVVERMKKDLMNLQPVLQKAAKETAELLKEVAADQKSADEVKTRVTAEEEAVGIIASEARAIAADAQRDLDEAMPAFQAAVKALESLDKKDTQEVKSFAKPPDLVQRVMEAICVLMEKKPGWDESKKLLNDSNFIQNLKDYDKDNIPEKIIKSLQKYIKMSDFDPESVGRVSKACKSLCMWAKAMDTYARVAKTVEPKKASLKAASDQLAESQATLKQKQDQLKEVEERVGELKRKLDTAQAKAKELEEQEKDTQVKLARAAKLVGGLSSEKVRWEELVVTLNDSMTNLVGNMVVCSGAIAYQGPFTALYRARLNAAWVTKVKALNIKCADNPTVAKVLADPVAVRHWGICGLPLDSLSVENAIFVTRSRRWSLMMDPQGQANRWIKNLQKENKLKVTKMTEAGMLRVLESSIRVGLPVLLENVLEKLDPALDPVLLKQTYKSQGRVMLRLGDTDVDYSEDFQFFVTTKLANPHYAPEVCIKVTLVNFTVTFEGLEDQLLADVAAIERPDLLEKKESLVLQISEGRKTIQELEDKILHLLATSTGNILDDEDLINTLDNSKIISTKTAEAVKGAEQTSAEIEVAQEAYRPVATRGSILYFVVSDFGSVDPMYQYSLSYFKEIFAKTVTEAEKSDDLEKRIAILVEATTRVMFVMICRGLFEQHKGLFAFLIAVSIMRQKKKVSTEEWAFFLKPALAQEGLPPNPSGDGGWLELKVWGSVNGAEKEVPALAGLRAALEADAAPWRAYAESDSPQNEPLPAGWEDKVTPFQRLLLLKIFRPEKVVFATNEFVASEMGDFFKEAPPFDLLSTFKDSACRVPIIFVLTSGADPTQYLLSLGKQQGYETGSNLKMVSLGQGQGPIAERLISEGKAAGHWVCLQNCHLSVSWLPKLDALLEELRDSADGINDDFRLWLTTMPTPEFPVAVLQSSLKLTQEPPKGLKANVGRAYTDMDRAMFEGCDKPGPFKKLIFGLCFFNAVIQERRKYGAVGWNIPYQWMTSDLIFAQLNLQLMLNEQPQTPFEALNVIISDVIYGGRVTDKQDVRLTRAILGLYLNGSAVDDDAYSYCPQISQHYNYGVPPEGPIDDYVAKISTFPLIDRPEIFGLHQNADISCQTKETNAMLEVIISLQPRTGGGGGGKTSDELVAEAAADMVANLPKPLNVKEGSELTFSKLKDGSMNPLAIFLTHEMSKFNILLSSMKKMLLEMQRAIKGLVVMSAELDAAYANFLFQQVPAKWGEGGVGYPSLKPLASWFKDFVERCSFMHLWLTTQPPSSFWIPAFFFPQGFLTSALQMYARKYQEAIDLLTFTAHVKPFTGLEDTPGPPEDGVYVHGMFVEGARFDAQEGSMAESNPGELFAPMFVVHLMPGDVNAARPAGLYECPFYKTNMRQGTLSTTGHSTNHVCNFDLPTSIDADHWIRRGAALIAMTND
jgi:dynein heavy chain